MTDFNTVVLTGRVVTNPDLKFDKQGNPICFITVQCSRQISKDDDGKLVDSTFEILATKRLAETFAKYGRKGHTILVLGTLKQVRWTDDSGNYHTRPRIVAQQIQFLGEQAAPPVDLLGPEEEEEGRNLII